MTPQPPEGFKTWLDYTLWFIRHEHHYTNLTRRCRLELKALRAERDDLQKKVLSLCAESATAECDTRNEELWKEEYRKELESMRNERDRLRDALANLVRAVALHPGTVGHDAAMTVARKELAK